MVLYTSTMRAFFLSVIFGLALALLSGCETYGPHAKRGTAYGGTTGAVVGQLSVIKAMKQEKARLLVLQPVARLVHF